MKRLMIHLSVLALCLGGCNKKEEKKAEQTPQEQQVKKPEPEKPKQKKKKRPKIDLSRNNPKTKLDLPTVAELEEEAAKDIKPENLESELDRLEAEIVGIPN